MKGIGGRRVTGAVAAGLLLVFVLAASSWSTDPETPGRPPGPAADDEPTAGRPSTTPPSRQRAEPVDSSPIDVDSLFPPFAVPEPRPVEVPGEVATGPPALENVEGIVVHQRLAPFIRTLLDQAEVAGVSLEGGGYRDPAAQRRLRIRNCPDPVNSPPSSCTPPTARPGESLHEYGLAVDFTSGGELIVDRDHPAYRFLQANAPTWGIEVHPQEPWHWSFGGG